MKNISLILGILFIVIASINIGLSDSFGAMAGWICAIIWCADAIIHKFINDEREY